MRTNDIDLRVLAREARSHIGLYGLIVKWPVDIKRTKDGYLTEPWWFDFEKIHILSNDIDAEKEFAEQSNYIIYTERFILSFIRLHHALLHILPYILINIFYSPGSIPY